MVEGERAYRISCICWKHQFMSFSDACKPSILVPRKIGDSKKLVISWDNGVHVFRVVNKNTTSSVKLKLEEVEPGGKFIPVTVTFGKELLDHGLPK